MGWEVGFSQGLKAGFEIGMTARLKPCPFKTVGCQTKRHRVNRKISVSNEGAVWGHGRMTGVLTP